MRPLVIFDLDNTLVDRAAIFSRWAQQFAAERSLDRAIAIPQIRALDDDGMAHRTAFFSALRDQFRIDDPIDDLVAAYWRSQIADFRCSDETLAALENLRRAGHAVGIATNGGPAQEDKIRAAGLDRIVDGWAVSGIDGSAKPDRRIFELVAERCGASLEGAWVVGDRSEADIAGAVAIGARSIWIHRGLAWSEPAFRPTHSCDSIASAAAIILGNGECS